MFKKLFSFLKERVKEPSTILGAGLTALLGPAALPFLGLFEGAQEATQETYLVNVADNPYGALIASVCVIAATLMKEGRPPPEH